MFQPKGETEAERKARLVRSLNALKACNTGKPNKFVGVSVGDPLKIDYHTVPEEGDNECVTEAEVEVISKGKKK